MCKYFYEIQIKLFTLFKNIYIIRNYFDPIIYNLNT